ncbi:Nin one binding Zn-ribbon like-domain-containing protein [Infundibulicybe gibba]|nr:Nin one binding Zn-ribbon like-domain-containing protein [Infundibulicybe gibba]
MENTQPPRCKNLVLDAGPLLSLSPLRGLAETYFTTPQVLAELKDKRAQEHFERLGLISGVKIEIRNPDAASVAHVIQWAKKTGDYSVLSHPDICVLALTYLLHGEATKLKEKQAAEQILEQTASAPSPIVESITDVLDKFTLTDVVELGEAAQEPGPGVSLPEIVGSEAGTLQPLDVQLESDQPTLEPDEAPTVDGPPASRPPAVPIYDDPSDSDDGEGEWITPANVGLHKSRALDLLPEAGAGGRGKPKGSDVIMAGCMTADFAMQNVLLQMGLTLVGVEGKRIEKVKSWVLRCHACFKICKDASKKFCPSCGNPTLLRASVTIASPTAGAGAPIMQVHLKPNFQYKIRGSKYSIPAPKPGSAKRGSGEGLILREDQTEYMRAKKRADGKRERDEAKIMKGILGKSADGGSINVGSWMDPDWVPEIMSAGAGGKGRSIRTSGMNGDMPVIGYGKKNPNEKRRK